MRRGTHGAVFVALGIFSSRVAGLVRERVFAYYLGNSEAAGAFRAALRIPNLLQNLFGEGVLSASFIPVYSRLLAEGRHEEAGKVAGSIAALLALITALLVALGIPASPWLVDILAPGFEGATRALAVELVTILFPGVGLLVLSAWCLGVLNSHRRFFLSYVAPVLWNTAVIGALIAFGWRYGREASAHHGLAVGAAWGAVAGAVLQLAVQLPMALKLNRGLSLRLDLRLEGVRRTLGNFVPALLSRGVAQLSGYVDQILSSFLGAGAVAALGYAQTISMLPLSLFGMALSAAELPELSRESAGEGAAGKLRERLQRGLERLSFFIVPSAVAMAALGDVIASTLFQTGRFGGDDARFVWAILGGSAIGLCATAYGRLCVSVYWATGDTRTPARLAIGRVAFNATLGVVVVFGLRQRYGLTAAQAAAGLTGAGSLAALLEYGWMRARLASAVGTIPRSRAALCHWGAALAAAGTAWLAKPYLPSWYPAVRGGVILAIFGAGYLAYAVLLGSPIARDFSNAALARLRRRR